MFKTSILHLDNPQLVKSLKSKYIDTGLSYGLPSNVDKAYDYGHWSKQVLQTSKFRLFDQAEMPMIKKYPELEFIWNTINQHMGGDRGLMRVYVNGYTYGTDAYAHIDDKWIPDRFGNDCTTETAVLYLNDKWVGDWAGETVIYTDDWEIETSVLPKEGRVLIFDSRKYHGARPVSRCCPVLRSVMVFKTFDKRFADDSVRFMVGKVDPDLFEQLHHIMCDVESLRHREDAAAAGLFHTAYTELNLSRDVVKNLIGETAESLVYEYSQLSNDRATDIVNGNFNNDVKKDLLAIEFARLYQNNSNKQFNQQLSYIHNQLQLL